VTVEPNVRFPPLSVVHTFATRPASPKADGPLPTIQSGPSANDQLRTSVSGVCSIWRERSLPSRGEVRSMSRLIVVVAATAYGMSGAALAKTEIFAPTGPWAIDYADHSCKLMRNSNGSSRLVCSGLSSGRG
jgi:hypothetical protein